MRVVDRFGLFEQRVVAREERRRVRVLPTEEAIKRLFVPYRVGAGLGDRLSANRGDGLEFADLRPFRPGDDLRRVNHRASARAGGLWVSDRHPERNADVILLADLLFDRGPGNRGVVDRVVQGAASLASAHISRHDRVGLVVLGGTVRWVTPRMGAIHRYRVLDALLETQLLHGWAGPMAGLLVARIVSGHALGGRLDPAARRRDGDVDLRSSRARIRRDGGGVRPRAALPAGPQTRRSRSRGASGRWSAPHCGGGSRSAVWWWPAGRRVYRLAAVVLRGKRQTPFAEAGMTATDDHPDDSAASLRHFACHCARTPRRPLRASGGIVARLVWFGRRRVRGGRPATWGGRCRPPAAVGPTTPPCSPLPRRLIRWFGLEQV